MPDEKVVVPAVAPVVKAPVDAVTSALESEFVSTKEFAKLVAVLADHGIYLK